MMLNLIAIEGLQLSETPYFICQYSIEDIEMDSQNTAIEFGVDLKAGSINSSEVDGVT
jgi:hypothetical protein